MLAGVFCTKLQDYLSGNNQLDDLKAFLSPFYTRYNYDRDEHGEIVRVTIERQKISRKLREMNIPVLTYANGITFELVDFGGPCPEWRIVCYPMPYLPNVPAKASEQFKALDDQSFSIYRLIDGVAVNLYYSHRKKVWVLGTSNCADIGPMTVYGKSYAEIFHELFGQTILGEGEGALGLNTEVTYSFIIRHPDIKWVCDGIPDKCIFFLGAHNNMTLEFEKSENFPASIAIIPRQSPLAPHEVFNRRVPSTSTDIVKGLQRMNNKPAPKKYQQVAPHFGWIIRNDEHEGYVIKSPLMFTLESQVYNSRCTGLAKKLDPSVRGEALKKLQVLNLFLNILCAEEMKKIFADYAKLVPLIHGRLTKLSEKLAARLRERNMTLEPAEDPENKLLSTLLENKDIQKINPFHRQITSKIIFDYIRSQQYFDILAEFIIRDT